VRILLLIALAIGICPLYAADAQAQATEPRVGDNKVFARQMEVYATLIEHADYEVGRLVQGIEDLGKMDNTLFIYIFGDRGCRA
jgi:arylsulfatase A-like enzyme